jgi:hypothetical protein
LIDGKADGMDDVGRSRRIVHSRIKQSDEVLKLVVIDDRVGVRVCSKPFVINDL